MRYIRKDDIKLGMVTAKPIYNEMGVLLYGRNTVVSDTVLTKVQNLDILGLYILEPTEPLPPLSEQDEEFEKFQMVASYTLKQEMVKIIKKQPFDLSSLVKDIIYNYGKLKYRIDYVQSIRSNKDSVYKHSVGVAMLCAIIASEMGIDEKDQENIITAALLHDIGKLIGPRELLSKRGALSPEELRTVRESEAEGYRVVRNAYGMPAGVRRYIVQLRGELENRMAGAEIIEQTLLLGTQIIKVADMFDTLTAMRVYKEPMSEFSALKFFMNHEDEYPYDIVEAIERRINVLPVGACVELTNGEKGLVLAHTPNFVTRPVVLGFSTNTVYDLSKKKVYDKVKIKDTLKTMDNRFVMNAQQSGDVQVG